MYSKFKHSPAIESLESRQLLSAGLTVIDKGDWSAGCSMHDTVTAGSGNSLTAYTFTTTQNEKLNLRVASPRDKSVSVSLTNTTDDSAYSASPRTFNGIIAPGSYYITVTDLNLTGFKITAKSKAVTAPPNVLTPFGTSPFIKATASFDTKTASLGDVDSRSSISFSSSTLADNYFTFNSAIGKLTKLSVHFVSPQAEHLKFYLISPKSTVQLYNYSLSYLSGGLYGLAVVSDTLTPASYKLELHAKHLNSPPAFGVAGGTGLPDPPASSTSDPSSTGADITDDKLELADNTVLVPPGSLKDVTTVEVKPQYIGSLLDIANLWKASGAIDPSTPLNFKTDASLPGTSQNILVTYAAPTDNTSNVASFPVPPATPQFYLLFPGYYVIITNNAGVSNPAFLGWDFGDYNYDGKIDGSDYTLIDNAFNR